MGTKILGNLYGYSGGNYAGNVYDKEGEAPTLLNVSSGGGRQPMIIEDKQIAAMRGRNPDNPSDRTTGTPTEQRLELNAENIANALTTVQKDNLVLEDICINDRGFTDREPQVTVAECPTLKAETHGNQPKVISRYRIRKLTPRECWRLMGFSDEDFDRAASVNSNSQLYKQAGNSIVKPVMAAIFNQLLPEKGEKYGD